MDRADVGMVQSRRGARFSLKPLQQILVICHRRREKFERDVPTEAGVLSFVNDAHTALAEL
jgi:hypothetical protein